MPVYCLDLHEIVYRRIYVQAESPEQIRKLMSDDNMSHFSRDVDDWAIDYDSTGLTLDDVRPTNHQSPDLDASDYPSTEEEN